MPQENDGKRDVGTRKKRSESKVIPGRKGVRACVGACVCGRGCAWVCVVYVRDGARCNNEAMLRDGSKALTNVIVSFFFAAVSSFAT